MKLKKYITAVFVCITAALLSLNTVLAEEEAGRDMDTLRGLGYFTLEAESPELPVTRGEAAAVIANILAPDRENKNTKTEFVDVIPEYWASEAVNKVYEAGLMGMGDDGRFRPEEPLKGAELMCVLVRLTGYEKTADKNGGYPAGYRYAATRAGIDIPAGDDEAVTYRGFCSALLKAMKTEVMLDSFLYNGAQTVSEKTYFEEALNITIGKGRVTATENLHFYGESSAGQNRIRIGDTLLSAEGTNTDLYMGYYVEYYYDAENETVLYIQPLKARNSVTKIEAEDLISIENGSISYYKDNTRRSISIGANADILVNGTAVGALPDAEDIESGSVTVIKGSDSAAFVRIDSYKTITVQNFNEAEWKIFAKYGEKEMQINPENTKLSVKDAFGNDIDPAIFKEWDILSAAQSENGEITNILYSTDKAAGYAGSVNDKGVVLDGVSYKFSKSAQKRADEITAGGNYELYFDAFGRIAAWRKTADTSVKYGYLTKLRYDDENETITARIFETDGTFSARTLSEKVVIDGVRFKSPELDKVKNALLREGRCDQVVLYKTDGDGNILYIDTANKGADEKDTTLTNQFNNFSNRVGSSPTRLKYSAATRIFSGKVVIDSNVKVMFIPKDADTASEDFFEVKAMNRYQQDKQYSLDCYTDNPESFVSELIVEYIDTTRALDSTSPGIFLVNDIYDTVNAAGEPVKGLSGFGPRGTSLTLTADSEVDFGNVKFAGSEGFGEIAAGDVIRYKLNPKGDIIHIELYFDESERRLLTKTNPSTGTATGIAYSDQHRFIWGNVYNKLGNTAMIVRDELPLVNDDLNSATWWEYQVLDKSALFVFENDRSGAHFRSITKDEIADWKHSGNEYSKVLAYTYWGDANLIVAYK